MPNNCEMFIVDDASDRVYCQANHRFEERVGIPRAKNKSLELAYNSGAKHIFLFDDDIAPINRYWIEPYVYSGINHLSYTFKGAYNMVPEKPDPEVVEIPGKGRFSVWASTNGCMLYFTRECIEVAGGFDEGFGLGVYEHADLTRRIYNMGLTPYINMDVNWVEKPFYSLDETGEVERTFTEKERDEQLIKGYTRYNNKKNDIEYINPSFNGKSAERI